MEENKMQELNRTELDLDALECVTGGAGSDGVCGDGTVTASLGNGVYSAHSSVMAARFELEMIARSARSFAKASVSRTFANGGLSPGFSAAIFSFTDSDQRRTFFRKGLSVRPISHRRLMLDRSSLSSHARKRARSYVSV